MIVPLDQLESLWLPHPGQKEFLLTPHRYRVLACGRRWGKTDACAASVFLELLSSAGSRQLILAPTLLQAEILFDRVVEFVELMWPGEAKIRRARYPSLQIGDHRVWARSGHVPRSLRGQGATHIIVDEAAFVLAELITDIALPMLATSHGRLTLLSTPYGKNHFWRWFMRGQDVEEEQVWSRQAPSSESPLVHPEFLAIQRQLLSERAYQVEYDAMFIESSSQVFKGEDIEAATVSQLPDPVGSTYIGIDWARYTDYTAIAVLNGTCRSCQLVHIEKFHGLSWGEQVRRVSEIVRRFPHAQVLCDGTSGGDVVTEMLQKQLTNHAVAGVHFTAPIKQELIERLAMLFDQRAIAMLPNLDLLRELQHFEAHHRPSGHTQLTAPSGYHDDLVIALALAARLMPEPYGVHIATGGRRNFHPSHAQLQDIQS